MAETTSSLRTQLSAVAPELRPIAENVLAAVRRIDLVALDADGIAHAILYAEPGEDPAALTHAVAASAWLSARLPDWCQLAPDAGIHSGTPARAVVVAERFHPDTLALADLLGAEHVRLIAIPLKQNRAHQAEPPRPDAAPAPRAPETPAPGVLVPEPASTPPSESRFRTGLEATDLGFPTS